MNETFLQFIIILIQLKKKKNEKKPKIQFINF